MVLLFTHWNSYVLEYWFSSFLSCSCLVCNLLLFSVWSYYISTCFWSLLNVWSCSCNSIVSVYKVENNCARYSYLVSSSILVHLFNFLEDYHLISSIYEASSSVNLVSLFLLFFTDWSLLTLWSNGFLFIVISKWRCHSTQTLSKWSEKQHLGQYSSRNWENGTKTSRRTINIRKESRTKEKRSGEVLTITQKKTKSNFTRSWKHQSLCNKNCLSNRTSNQTGNLS